MHDKIWADRRRLAARIRQPTQAAFDLRQPNVEFLHIPAIDRRESADHAVTASGRNELDARHQKHGRSDQRQSQPIAEARERIGSLQSHD
jgi:hypothetical protein